MRILLVSIICFFSISGATADTPIETRIQNEVRDDETLSLKIEVYGAETQSRVSIAQLGSRLDDVSVIGVSENTVKLNFPSARLATWNVELISNTFQHKIESITIEQGSIQIEWECNCVVRDIEYHAVNVLTLAIEDAAQQNSAFSRPKKTVNPHIFFGAAGSQFEMAQGLDLPVKLPKDVLSPLELDAYLLKQADGREPTSDSTTAQRLVQPVFYEFRRQPEGSISRVIFERSLVDDPTASNFIKYTELANNGLIDEANALMVQNGEEALSASLCVQADASGLLFPRPYNATSKPEMIRALKRIQMSHLTIEDYVLGFEELSDGLKILCYHEILSGARFQKVSTALRRYFPAVHDVLRPSNSGVLDSTKCCSDQELDQINNPKGISGVDANGAVARNHILYLAEKLRISAEEGESIELLETLIEGFYTLLFSDAPTIDFISIYLQRNDLFWSGVSLPIKRNIAIRLYRERFFSLYQDLIENDPDLSQDNKRLSLLRLASDGWGDENASHAQKQSLSFVEGAGIAADIAEVERDFSAAIRAAREAGPTVDDERLRFLAGEADYLLSGEPRSEQPLRAPGAPVPVAELLNELSESMRSRVEVEKQLGQ